MKMNRALSLAMAGALGLSLLAGCGGGSGSATPAPADTSAPADHSGASGVIKIGGIGPLTGSAAVYGLATKQGAEVAVAEINALGGLQFSLDFQDDEGDAEKAVNAYNKLKGDGVQLIYGCTTTTPCVAVAAETFNDRY
ncbi:ABC transporter substrate-binding protein, partial [Intestinimonas butyriciproducens]